MKKKEIFKTILIGAGVLVLALAGVVSAQPSGFRVTRKTTIAAPPDVVFAQVNDLYKLAVAANGAGERVSMS